MYRKLTHVEHILARPDSYVGSLARETTETWVDFQRSIVSVSPGLVKIFDEVLVNAIDQHSLNPKKTTRIDVTFQGDVFSVRNNGDGTFSDVTAGSGLGDPRWSTSAAFADYEATLGGWLSDVFAAAEWSVAAGDLTVVQEGDGRAVVELSSFDLVATGHWETDEDIYGELDMGAEEAMVYEARRFAEMACTYDKCEGLSAFLQKRRPQFEDR